MTIKSSQGFSLVQAMVSIAIASIVSLGVAASINSGIDGMSHQKSFSAAEDMALMVQGFMGDSNFCTAHFKNKIFDRNGTMPQIVAPDVTLYEVDANGGLITSNPILSVDPTKKFQNVNTIQGISLVVNKAVNQMAGVYWGSVIVNIKGTKLDLKREIPVSMTVDAGGKIIACGRVVIPTQVSVKGSWSSNCTDFLTQGWQSMSDCLRDGRWHLAYSNDANGNATYGSVNDLKNHVNNGAEVRVAIRGANFTTNYDTCSSVSGVTTSSFLVCMTPSRSGVPNWPAHQISTAAGVAYFTDGSVSIPTPTFPAPPQMDSSNGTYTTFQMAMDWFVKF